MKAKPKAAIYARYSSKIQNPLSVADQVALCRRLIEREFCVPGGEAAVFSDHERKCSFRPWNGCRQAHFPS